MRRPDPNELELLRLVASAPCLDHGDPRLNKFSDDKSTLSKPDTFNRCEDMGWLKSRHDHDTSSSTVEITQAGRAIILAMAAA